MLASIKAMDALKGIGLNLYERKLWVALLARGTSTAGELSEIADVPRSRAYDVLQSLATKGFVVVQNAKPIRYVAIAPDEALDKAQKKMQEEIEETVDRMDELKKSTVMKELNEVFSSGMKLVNPEEMTGALRGKYSLHQQLESMFKDANKNISIVTTPEGLNELFASHYDSLKKANERGVHIKIATAGTEKTSEAIKAFSDVAEVRNVDEKEAPIAGRFFVVDEKELVFALTDTKTHSTQDMAFWSKSEHAAGDVLAPIFKLVWNHSKPVS